MLFVRLLFFLSLILNVKYFTYGKMLRSNYKALSCKFAYTRSCHLLHCRNNVPKSLFFLTSGYLSHSRVHFIQSFISTKRLKSLGHWQVFVRNFSIEVEE